MAERMTQNDPAHVWDLIEDVPMALLITRDGQRADARPMSATARRKEDAIYILANAGEDSDRQIKADGAVVLSFQKNSQTYIVVQGHARSTNDRVKIADLWTPFAKAWWDGPDDPRICLLTVTPESAEYWESPGKLIAYAKMLTAAATGAKPDVGEHGGVRL